MFPKPALLTKSEIDWLSGSYANLTKSYEYKMKSTIRRKLKTLTNLEIPLIQKIGMFSEDLYVFSKNLTPYGKTGNSIYSSNPEKCAQNMVGRKG